MKYLILAIFILFHLISFAQLHIDKYNFSRKVTKVEGALNKDNLTHKVILTKDTLNENAAYRLQLFFKEPNGQLKLIVTSI